MIHLIVGAWTIAILAVQSIEKQSPPLSVCELITRRSDYAGRMVVVRGEVKAGGHGQYLTASACEHRLATKGVVWPNIIYLTFPDNRSKEETFHADFQVDWRSVRLAEAQERRAAFNSDTDQLLETLTGLFVTYRNLEERVTPGVLRLGFGPVGLEAPAQLLIKSIRDVVVVHPARR
jgi:hypothetical protein